MEIVSDVDRAIEQLEQLWCQERRETRRRFNERREGYSPRERQQRGVALLDLEVEETAAAYGGRVKLWLTGATDEQLEQFQGRNGSPVVLWWEDPAAEESVQAVVSRRRDDRLAVVVDEVPERVMNGRFHLDLEAPDVTFERGRRALQAFRQPGRNPGRRRLRKVLFGIEQPGEGLNVDWTPRDEMLNEGQRRAVERALKARHLALVHGPPGTGKTRTLVEVVRQLAARGQKILATAASNAAVDNLAARLVRSGVGLVRVGHPARVDPKVEQRTLDALLEATDDYAIAQQWMDEARQIRRRTRNRIERDAISRGERREAFRRARRLFGDAKGHLRRMQASILDNADVICATATGADSSLLDDLEFDVVVLDEATQATDPVALVAMCRAPKVVMAGDPHQLPPTVIDMEAAEQGLGTTFFERLSDHAVMLTRQYRMHRAIMEFPSHRHYDGRLAADEAVAGHRLSELPGVAADDTRIEPVVFVDTAGKGWDEQTGEDDPSICNPDQAARTAGEARRLLGRGLQPDQLAVITPYAAQVRVLREKLDVQGLEIGTVDGFQGREKEAIIVDLVRCNDDGEIGFLKDTRRMNVALTRARRQLVVIGDSATIGDHDYYTAFLDEVQQYGQWVSAWSDTAEPFEAVEVDSPV